VPDNVQPNTDSQKTSEAKSKKTNWDRPNKKKAKN
jgi:hypothetical protein